MKLKTSIKKITIGEYEQYLSLLFDETKDNLTKNIEAISIFSQLSIGEIESLKIRKYKSLMLKLSTINFHTKKIKNEIKINGIIYKSNSTKDNIKINVKESFLMRDLEVPTPSKLMGIFFRPVNNHNDYSKSGIEERSKLFKDVSVDYILPYLTYNYENS